METRLYLTQYNTTQSIEIKTVLSIFASLFILIPYCYIPAAFTVFIVRERVTKSKVSERNERNTSF